MSVPTFRLLAEAVRSYVTVFGLVIFPIVPLILVEPRLLAIETSAYNFCMFPFIFPVAEIDSGNVMFGGRVFLGKKESMSPLVVFKYFMSRSAENLFGSGSPLIEPDTNKVV